MTPKPDSVAVPHSVILPLADEREAFPFQVDSFNNFSLEFDVLPTFGSKVLGKAVAIPATFAELQSQGSYVVPLLDPSLKVIGDIPFELNIVKPFERATLQLGGQVSLAQARYSSAKGADPLTSAVRDLLAVNDSHHFGWRAYTNPLGLGRTLGRHGLLAFGRARPHRRSSHLGRRTSRLPRLEAPRRWL